MSEGGEGPKPGEQVIGGPVEQQPEPPKDFRNPAYEDGADKASAALQNKDLNPHLNGPTLKQKVMGGLAAMGITFGAGVAVGDEVKQAVDNTASAAAATTRDVAEVGVNTVKAPYEVVKNGLDAITPDNNPDKPRNPDQVMVGSVSITPSEKLNVRTSPNIPGKESPGNEISWDKVKLVNQVVVDGKLTLVPIEYNEGDTLIIENPDIVFGQNSGGGFGHDEKAQWIMLYTQNNDGELRAVYVARQQETFPHVQVSSENIHFIDATTRQDSSDGVKVIQFSEPTPDVRNHITVQPAQSSPTVKAE